MSGYSVDYLERLLRGVEEFEAAFDRWAQTQHEFDHLEARGLFPTVRRRDDANPADVRDLELQVAQTAGYAAKAVSETGAYIMVSGRGPIDPIANWFTMSAPKAVVSPHDIRATAATVKGRLRQLIDQADAEVESGIPAFAPSRLHPLIWSAAADHWTIHHYRVAVAEAAETLTSHWKARLDRQDVDATPFWQQTLSEGDPAPGRPKLVWPDQSDSKTAKGMRGGLPAFGKVLAGLSVGLNLTVRNSAAHDREEITEQEAMERLAAYSLLARFLDQCEIRQAVEPVN